MSDKYRKKPVVIDARQWFSDGQAPSWAHDKVIEKGDHFLVPTLEGTHRGDPGD